MKKAAQLFTILSLILVCEMAQAGVLKRFCETLLLGQTSTLPAVQDSLPAQRALPAPEANRAAVISANTPPRPQNQADAHVQDRNTYLKTQTPDVILKKAYDAVSSLSGARQLPKEVLTALNNQDAMAIDSRFITYLVHNNFLQEIIAVDGLKFARTDQGLFDYIASYLASHKPTTNSSDVFLLYFLETDLGRAQAIAKPDSVFELAAQLGTAPDTLTFTFLKWYKLALSESKAAETKQATQMMKRVLNSLLPRSPTQIRYELNINPDHNLSGTGTQATHAYLTHLSEINKGFTETDKILFYSLLESTLTKHWIYLAGGLQRNDYQANHDLTYNRNHFRQLSFSVAINHYSAGLLNTIRTLTAALAKKVILEEEDSANVRLSLVQFRTAHTFYQTTLFRFLSAKMRPDLDKDYRNLAYRRLNELHEVYLKNFAESEFGALALKFQQTVLLNPSVLMNPKMQALVKSCRTSEQAQCLFEQFMRMSEDEFESYFEKSTAITKGSSQRSTSGSSPTSLNRSGTGSTVALRRQLR